MLINKIRTDEHFYEGIINLYVTNPVLMISWCLYKTIRVFIIVFFLLSNYTPGQIADPGENLLLKKYLYLFENKYKDNTKMGIQYAKAAIPLAQKINKSFIAARAHLYIAKHSYYNNGTEVSENLRKAITLGKILENQQIDAEANYYLSMFYNKHLNRSDSALMIMEKAFSLSLEVKDTTLLKKTSLQLLQIYRQLNYPVKAIKISEQALEWNKSSITNKTAIYIALGILYTDIGNHKKAFTYYNEALELCKKTKNDMQLASLTNNLAAIYSETGNPDKAINYHKQALDIYKKLKSDFGIAYTYNICGMTYSRWNNHEKAIECFKEAGLRFKKLKNYQSFAFASTNIASEYLKTGKTTQTIFYINQAIEAGERLNDKLSLSDAYKTAASYYRTVNNIPRALEYLLKAESFAKEINNPNFLKDIYNEISICYDLKKDNQNALLYLKRHNEIADTIAKQTAQKAYIEMLVKYETEKITETVQKNSRTGKGNKIETDNKYILLVTGMFLILIFFIYPGYKKRKFLSALSNSSLILKLRKNENSIAHLKKYNLGNNRNNNLSLELFDKLEILVNQEKIYLSPNLSLHQTAEFLGTNTSYLSRIINEKTEMNFNNFINKYRIEEAKRIINSDEFKSYTLEGISKSCGFTSRSAFNSAFKKFTGMTPTEYANQVDKV